MRRMAAHADSSALAVDSLVGIPPHLSRVSALADIGGRAPGVIASQTPAESGVPERKAETADVQKGPDLPQDSEAYMGVHKSLVGDSGFEPLTSCVSSRRSIHLS